MYEFVCRPGWRFILAGDTALAVTGAWNRGYSSLVVFVIHGPELNGSGQESCKHHFDWNFQVCQNPPKLRKPTCVMWKDVPVVFSQEPLRKDLTNRHKSLPPSLCAPEWCWKNLSSFLLCSTGFLISRVSKFSIFQEERSNWVGGWVGVWGGGGGDWTLGLFLKSFLPAFREKQHSLSPVSMCLCRARLTRSLPPTISFVQVSNWCVHLV